MSKTENEKIILASASPRRRELMKLLGVDFVCKSADIEETADKSLKPCDYVCSLAEQKALAVKENGIIIGADTVVVCGGEILGKPKDKDDAFKMLRKLSGRMHEVYTGICLAKESKTHIFYCRTEVWFYDLSDEEIQQYVSSGEPMDKAGAYGIQGRGALLVERINGDYFNVVGLPVSMLKREIKKFISEVS